MDYDTMDTNDRIIKIKEKLDEIRNLSSTIDLKTS